MTATSRGRRDWHLTLDKEGHREYTLVTLVETSDVADGPQVVGNCSGLAAIGSIWAEGNDVDAWAFCWPTMRVERHQPNGGEPGTFWLVTQTFNTRPLNRCQDTKVEDPLLEPDKVSGSFTKYTMEATVDKDGNPIENSSGEELRGNKIEIDSNRVTVRIEQNVANLELPLITELMNTVNDDVLWGLAARTIKLSSVAWERKLYGSCNYYYTRILDFDIDFNTFDRTIWDEGTKVLKGSYADDGGGSWENEDIGGSSPDKDSYSHYIQAVDRNGNNTTVKLDSDGNPADEIADINTILFQFYTEQNFLLLGIPILL